MGSAGDGRVVLALSATESGGGDKVSACSMMYYRVSSPVVGQAGASNRREKGSVKERSVYCRCRLV